MSAVQLAVSLPLAPPATQRNALSAGGLVWASTLAGTAGILLSNALPTFGALIFVAAWLAVLIFHGRDGFRALGQTPVIWLYPSFVLLSTLWSVASAATLRYALEDFLTVAAAILAARLQTPRSFATALMLAMLVVAIASVAFGTSQVDPLTGESAFVGLFGSKNQVGLLSTMLLLTSFALLLDRGAGLLVHILSLAGALATLPLLYMSRSGTSLVTACVTAAFLCANLFLSRLPARMRPIVVFAALASLIPLVLLAGVAGDVANDFIVDVLGKDTTLTGRTILWAHALSLIPSHPVGGVGAGAFWLQDTVEAEGLWHEFHVEARAGFHFHNTYLEDAIELGLIGSTLFVAALLSTAALCARWSWRERGAMSSLFVAIIVCLLIRSFVEIDMIAPFAIGTFLLFVAAAYGLSPPRSGQAGSP